MSEITVPFRFHFKAKLIDGTKVYTARTKRLGNPGDVFEAFGNRFELLSVKDVSLYEVSLLWKEEGCSSREDFVNVWKSIHPRTGYSDSQRVYLHNFKRTPHTVLKMKQALAAEKEAT